MLRNLFGKIRKLNKLWLLLLIPLSIVALCFVALPSLLLAMMIGTNFLSIFTGPINIWNTPSQAPPAQDVVGIYYPNDRSRSAMASDHVTLSNSSYIRLNADQTVELHDIPTFDQFGDDRQCNYNTTGKWSFYETGSEVQINLELDKAEPSCGSQNFGPFIELVGRHAPYRLYSIIGDPDSGTGIMYIRR